MHRRALILREDLRIGLGQRPPAADHQRRVVDLEAFLEIASVIGQDLRGQVLGNGQHHHPVVGKQAALDGIGKADLVEDRPVELFVVHRAEGRGQFAGPGAGALGVDLRGRGHIEAPIGPDAAIAVNPGEVRLLLARKDRSRRAVRLVADRQVEPGQAAVPLGAFENRGGLVGGEDHGHLLRIIRPGPRRQFFGIGGGRPGEVQRVHVDAVVWAFLSLADLAVRADREGP